jgi:hypothetical protein
LIQEQITGENFMTHSYVTLLLELVLASATGAATVMCPPPNSLHAGHQVGMYQEFSSTLNILEIFYNFILFFLHSIDYHDILTCKYVFLFRNLHLVTHCVDLPY